MTPAARRIALAVFALALVLRGGWVLAQWARDGAALTYDDERLHWQLATHLVRDGALVSDDGRFAARLPLYPLFVAGGALLGETGVLVVRLMQALVGALTAALAAELAGLALDRRAAVLAGLLVALDPFAIFFSNLLLNETLFAALLVGLALASWHELRIAGRRPGAALLAAGALAGAAVLTRPEALLLVALQTALLAAASRGRRDGALRAGVLALAVAAPLGAFGLRNAHVLGGFAPLGANGGVTLYDGQGPQADGRSDQAFLQHLPQLDGLGELERDRALRSLALAEMAADPWRVTRLAGAKLARTWSPWPNVADYRGGVAGAVGALYTLCVVAAALVGAWRLRARRVLLVNLLLPAVATTLTCCIFIGSVRYRVPAMPLLAVVAAGAVPYRRPSL
ncbi:MAG: glycosyltransferase family 39 protein [Phycisphaerae bacterium]